jgi:error-prone DNA polymerase
MVHPYLRRRRGEEEITYPSEALKEVLERTYGVPLFQEQAMQIAIVAAGFTATEADALRRALNGFRRQGAVEDFKERFIAGCLANGYERAFAENCFKQLEGFSSYGFPESHAASFALLVYASSWIKCHHPEVFCCGLLNSQPMGFYAPAQIVRDAEMHGVNVLPICIENSFWDNVLEYHHDGSLAVRLGFRQIKGLSESDGHWIAAARGNGYRSIEAVWRRAGIGRPALTKLAGADAFISYGIERRDALWAVKGLGGDKPLPLFERDGEGLPDIQAVLPELSLSESVFEDYVSTRLTLREHPITLLRPQLPDFVQANTHRHTPDGTRLSVSGLVITRQRPGTASGVIFLTLEDNTHVSNVVVWPKMFERYRKEVMAGRLLHITGRLQREGPVTHIVATKIVDYSYLLDGLGYPEITGDSIDPTRDNADEAKRPVPDLRTGPRSRRRENAVGGITDQLQAAHRMRIASGARHPREQAKKLFYSRDFH